MDDAPLVVGVAGSRRDGSNTRTAVEHAVRFAAAAGAETDLIHLGDVDLPLYHPDVDDVDAGDAVELKARMREADAVVFGTPVYHGSYSSTLKNFHDYCGSDEFEDTAVGLLAVAGGSTYSSTLDHMRSTVRNVHGHVIPEQVGIGGVYDAFEDGQFADEGLAERVEAFAEALVETARRMTVTLPAAADAETGASADD